MGCTAILFVLLCGSWKMPALATDGASGGTLPVQGGSLSPKGCPAGCFCTDNGSGPSVDCSSLDLSVLPGVSNHLIISLDLSVNNISEIPRKAFDHLHFLSTLKLSSNRISSIHPRALKGLINLITLALNINGLEEIEPNAFIHVKNLQELNLASNFINRLVYASLNGLQNLRSLKLDDNRLTRVPTEALKQVQSLEFLDLSVNSISAIPDNAFVNLRNLGVLVVRENRITTIGGHGFDNLPLCRCLYLDFNNLTDYPLSATNLTKLRELTINDNQIRSLPDKAFSKQSDLRVLMLHNNPLRSVGRSTFTNLRYITSIQISGVSEQDAFPDFEGCEDLQELTVSGGRFASIPPGFCHPNSTLTRLTVSDSRLTSLRSLSDCSSLEYLDVSGNQLRSVSGNETRNLTNLRKLNLSNNRITTLDETVFEHMDLEELNLALNSFSYLPVRGLRELRVLNLTGVHTLLYLPPVQLLDNLRFLDAAFSYHCCQVSAKWRRVHTSKWDSSAADKAQPVICYPEPGPLTPCIDLLPSVIFRIVLWLVLVVSLVLNITIITSNVVRRCWKATGQSETRIKRARNRRHDGGGESDGGAKFSPSDDDSPSAVADCFELALCHLALSDVIASAYVGFLVWYDASTRNSFAESGAWWQQSVQCRAAGFFLVMGVQLAFFTVLIAAVERYLSTMFPLKPEKHIGKSVIGLTLCAAWVVSVATAIVTLYSGAKWYPERPSQAPFPPFNGATCLPWATDFPYVAVLIGGHVIACMVVLILCGLMFCARRKQSWLSPQKHTRTQITAIALCNVFCILPLAAMGLLTSAIATYPPAAQPFLATTLSEDTRYITEAINVDLVLMIVMLLLCLRLCVNPILYVAFGHGFRQDVGRIAHKIFCVFSPSHFHSYQSDDSASSSGEDFTFAPGRSQVNAAVESDRSEEEAFAAHDDVVRDDSDEMWQQSLPSRHFVASQAEFENLPYEGNVHRVLVNTSRRHEIPPRDFDNTHASALAPDQRHGLYASTNGYDVDVDGAEQRVSCMIHSTSSEQPCTSRAACSADDKNTLNMPRGRLSSQRSRFKRNHLQVDVFSGRPPWPQPREDDKPPGGIGVNKLSQSCESSTSKDSGIQSEPDFSAGCAYSSGSSSLARSTTSQTSDGALRIHQPNGTGCVWYPVQETHSAPVQHSQQMPLRKLRMTKVFLPRDSKRFLVSKPVVRTETVL